MGAGLVMRVYEGPHAALTPNARHVLVRMSVSALDCDPEPAYWAGWQPLAMALCLKGKEQTNRVNVRNYIRELHDAGAVTLTRRGSSHGPSRYRLWLDMPAPRQADGGHENCLACPVDKPPHAVDNPLSTAIPGGAIPTLSRGLDTNHPEGAIPTPYIRRKRSTRSKEYYERRHLKSVRPVDNPKSA